MMTIYEISQDYLALESLINEMTDENGETREFTDEEREEFTKWTAEIEGNFQEKFNNIYKVYTNLKAQSKVAEAERDALKDEMDRLKKRADARNNEACRVKGLIGYAMDVLKIKKLKTNLFTIGYQVTKKCARTVDGFFSADDIPVKYLKRELSVSAINEAIAKGDMYEKEGVENRTKLFYRDENGYEQVLKGVSYSGAECLVLR